MAQIFDMLSDGETAARKMDDIYRYQRYIYDLTRKYYLLGRERLLHGLRAAPSDKILEIGCGTGRNLLVAAKLYPQSQIFGFDISRAMLETSARAIRRKRLDGRVVIAQGDATQFNTMDLFSVAGFERVYISYTLSMIPVWHEVLPAAADALAPGGELHIVDFGTQQKLPGWFKRALFAWLAHFSVHPSGDVGYALEYIAQERKFELEYRQLYRGYAYYAVLRRPLQ